MLHQRLSWSIMTKKAMQAQTINNRMITMISHSGKRFLAGAGMGGTGPAGTWPEYTGSGGGGGATGAGTGMGAGSGAMTGTGAGRLMLADIMVAFGSKADSYDRTMPSPR